MQRYSLVSRILAAAWFAGGVSALPAAAQDVSPDVNPDVSQNATLEEIVITGEYPGPGLWKVTRTGDASNHVLWIVGDPWPLPKRMKWKSSQVEATALGAQEILRDASVTMQPDEKIGVLRGLTLVPAMLKARRNPEDEKLEDVLPPALYQRWLTQKRLYLGRESGVESWRPIFAADKLRKAAFEELGLRERGVVWDVIGKLVEKRRIKVTTPLLTLKFPRDQVRAKIKEFSRESLADMECFSTTLDLTEALARRDVEIARARAWATADLAALAAMPPLPSPYFACAMAVMTSQVAREVIPADIVGQVEKLWLDAVAAGLAANQTTFAIVPLPKLTREGGYLSRLRALGYLIEAPE